ncbi:hypothetical protein M3Y99_01119700 [Aphelenchoides fujianensis]|nr:hypothetical protein M3Y99_01119700 [Aphelenchoides fujianensis]
MPSDALLAKMREVEEWRQKNKLLDFEFEIVRTDVEAKQKATREMQQRVAEMRGQNAAIHSSVEKIQATAEESPTSSVLFAVLEQKLDASHATALAQLETLSQHAEETEELRAKFEEEKSRCEWLRELEEVEQEHETATAELAETKRELERTTANCEEAERILNERKEFELNTYILKMSAEAVEAKKLRQKLARLLVLNKKLRAEKKGGSVDEEDEEVEEPPVLQEDDEEEEVVPAAAPPEEAAEVEVEEQPLEDPTHQPAEQVPEEPLDDPLEILIDEPEKQEPEDDDIQVIDVIERTESPAPPLIGEEQPEEGEEEEADGDFLGFNLFDQPDGDEADGEQEAEAGDENDAFFTSQLSTASSGVHGFNVDRCSPPTKKKAHERKAFGQARQPQNTGDDSSPLAFELVADESGSPTGFDFGAESSNGTRSSAGSFNFNFGFEDGEQEEAVEGDGGFNFSFENHD